MRILVSKFRHIGDVLLSSALIDNLHRHYPGATIDVAVNDFCAAVLTENPQVNRVYSYPRGAIKAASVLRRVRLEWAFLRECLAQRYDLVINLTEGDRGALLAAASRAPRRLGIAPRNWLARLPLYTAARTERIPMHAVEKDLAILRLLDKSPLNKQVSLHWPESVDQAVDRKLEAAGVSGAFVHVHPVARWLFKCWRAEAFAEVIDTLQRDFHLPVVLTASPDEAELARVNEITALCRTAPVDWSGQLSLLEVGCLSRRARFFLGVDTAPMHMAAAVETPVIALFGPSEPHVWGPWDSTGQQPYSSKHITQRNGPHIVIQHPDDEILFVDGVKISTAMHRISPQEVLEAVQEVLAR